MALDLGKIIDKGVSTGTEKLGEGSWVDSALKKGREQVIPNLPTGLHGAAGQSFDRIGASKGSIGTVSQATFLKITSYLSLGLEDEARLLYLRERASHDERQAALKKAMGQAYDANLASKQAWDDIKAAALDVLLLMGKAALPLLLAAAV
jgi:hypothetical protein